MRRAAAANAAQQAKPLVSRAIHPLYRIFQRMQQNAPRFHEDWRLLLYYDIVFSFHIIPVVNFSMRHTLDYPHMEATMTTTKPTKQKLREYLYARQRSPEPPPTPEQIRRELGWRMTQPTR